GGPPQGPVPPVPGGSKGNPGAGAQPKAGNAVEAPFTEEPRANPMPPPGGGPAPPTPPGQPRPPTVDENPFPEPSDGDSRSKSLQAFAALWERNVGPLDETPEVKRALFDIVSGNGLDFDLKDSSGKSIWDLLNKGDGGGSFGEFLKGGEGGSWKFPQLEFPKLRSWFGSSWFGGGGSSGGGSSGGGSGPSMPRPDSSGSGGGGLRGRNFAGSWTPVILLGVVVFGVLAYFWLRKVRLGSGPGLVYALGGLGPWPVDPRAINTREDVVKAFEYLS